MQSFLYPDYTVGSGVSPNHVILQLLALQLVGFTTDRESHPAPKDYFYCNTTKCYNDEMSFPQLELQHPHEFLQDFLTTAKQAKKRIWLQSMNYDPSSETESIEKVLVEKGGKGIDVRMNIDWVSERFFDHSFNSFPSLNPNSNSRRKAFNDLRQASLNRIRQAGGQVVITNKPSYVKSFFPIAGRNHIKMYIVDDTVWMGGVNLVKDGFSIVDGMVKTDHPEFMEALTTQFFQVNELKPAEHYAVEIHENLELLVDNGAIGKSLIYDEANKAILTAQKEIQLFSQIMPTGKLMQNLLNKSKQGIPVSFITSNEDDDVFSTFPQIAFYQAFKLQIRKNKNFKLKHLNGKLHLKLLLIDNKEFFFGSHNLSQVGVQLGTEEIMLHGTDEKMIQKFKKMYGSLT